MAKKSKNIILTKKEQSTTTAYKMMSDKINNLEASLKKTQDGSEVLQQTNHELDKKVAMLENKLEKNGFIEILKFISAGGVGFAVNYFTAGLKALSFSIGIPSVIIFIICVVVNKR